MLAVDAQSAPQSVWVQSEEIVLQRGQVGWSITALATEWKRSRPWVMGFLRWLQDQGMAVVDSNNRRTIITIVNYDAYQAAPVPTGLTTEVPTGLTTELTHKGKGERGKEGNGKGERGNPPLPEMPDDGVLAAWFAGFCDPARGVQGIPEVWWRGWVSSRLNAQRWPADWQAAARMSFLGDFANRHPKAIAGIGAQNKKNAAGPSGRMDPAPGGRTVAQARFELSKELEGVRKRLDACHEIGVQPAAADVKREKELQQQLKDLGE